MRGHWLAALLSVGGGACLPACDPGEAPQPRLEAVAVAPARDFASGSRLRARYHVIDGLVAVLTTFHDAKLDIDCAYEDESGGANVGPNATSYCLPPVTARHREGRGPFLDRACTMRAAFSGRSAAGAAATYAVIEPRDACATAPELHVARAPENRRAFLRDDDGACVEAESRDVQQLGDLLPPDTFVRAVEQVEPRDGRIATRALVGEDGSRRVVGGFDRARNEPVRVATFGDGSRRWAPARLAFVGGGELLFAEGSCATPAAAKIGRTATCPLSAAVVLEGNCGAGRYFTVGERLASVFVRDAASACVARPAAEELAFRLGDPIDASAFAPVSSIDVGGSRVRRTAQSSDGDVPVSWGDVIDVESGEACVVTETADGALRCLPAAAAPVVLFADAACTEPALARAVTGCETSAGPRLVRDSFDAPPRVFEVGRELTAVYAREGGRCVPFVSAVPSRHFAVREIDASRFPPATLAAE